MPPSTFSMLVLESTLGAGGAGVTHVAGLYRTDSEDVLIIPLVFTAKSHPHGLTYRPGGLRDVPSL